MSPSPSIQSMSRRSFVARLGVVLSGAALVPLLGACGSTTTQTATSSASAAASTGGSTSSLASSSTGSTSVASASAVATGTTRPATGATSSAVSAGTPLSTTSSPAALVASGQGVPGGTLRATLGAEPSSLDPHQASTTFDGDVRNNLFDGLVQDGDPQNLPGALAEKWDSADAKSWTFYLRQGALFHDGTEVTSDIVKSSIERTQNPATKTAGALRTVAAEIVRVTAVDKYTVKVDLKAPNGAFPLEMVDIKIVPPNFNATKPVGTGPFQFVEWVRNQHITLKKNPNYFMKGLPYLDQVIFQPVPDENQKVVLLQAGQVDFTDTIPLPRVKEIQAAGKIVVQSVPAGVSPSSYFMEAKTDVAPLNDPRVRQAINYAIDRQAQLDVTFGVGTVKSNPIPPKHWAFDPKATSYNQRDVAKAKQLLAQAGHGSGFNLQLKYITSRAEYATMAQLFQTSMADIGIKVDLVPQELNVWVDDVLNKHNFQLGLTGITPNYDPDQIMRRFDPTDQDGAAMAWRDDQYLSLLDQGKALATQDQRKPVYAQAQEIEQTASPGFIMNERPILYGSTPAVQGFRPDIRQHTDFYAVWLKK